MASSSSSAAAASPPAVRVPDPQVHERLIDEDEGDENSQYDSDMELVGSSSSKPLAPPRVASSRVVDQQALAGLTCCAYGTECVEHIPTDLVTLNCPHPLCRSCLGQLSRPIRCPTCRVPAPPHVAATNHGLMGLVEKLIVRCKHSPACGALYTLGCGMRNEALHLATCLQERVDDCAFCSAPLLRGAVDAHRAVCVNRKEECKQCGEQVSVSEMEAHINSSEWEDWCTGMVPCPNGCEQRADQTQPSAKVRRISAAGDKDNGLITRLRPSDLEAHLLVCPCRPAFCPFAGCNNGLLHHEVTDHMGSRKHLGSHLQGLLSILQAQQAGALQREAALQSQIDALQRNPRMDPFPGYTRILSNTLLCVPKSAMGPRFKWPKDCHQWVDIQNDGVDGVSRILMDIYEEEEDTQINENNKRNRGGAARPAAAAAAASSIAPAVARGRKLAVEVHFVPFVPADSNVEPEVRQRQMGITISVLRASKPGDRNAFMGACFDDGVYLERFTAEFTQYSNIQRKRFDAFEMAALERISNVPGALSGGFRPHFSIGVDLFEKLPAAAE